MEVGIGTTCSDWSVDPATVARIVEDAGIALLSFGEHTHIPASRETPYPGGSNSGNGALPPGYERSLDLFITLTIAALATTDLKLGTGILQVVQRDPIITAKEVATLDHVSGGRFDPDHRIELEPGGDAQSRDRPRDPLRAARGACARDARDLGATTRRHSTATS